MIHCGDALTVLRTLPEASAHCCITSPPYWGLRDYGTAEWKGGRPDCDHLMIRGTQGKTGQRADRTHTQRQPYKTVCKRCGAKRVDQQIGLEKTPGEYVARLVEIFREVRRVLRDDATVWINLGDCYNNSPGQRKQGVERNDVAGWKQSTNEGCLTIGSRHVSALKPKNLIGMPWRVAFALQEDGWILRSEIIWHKPNPMPESVQDRPTRAHEQIFLLSKNATYFYDFDAVLEPVAGSSHARGSGVNPKAAKWPAGWSAEEGRHDGIPTGKYRPKQNASFSGSVNGLVENRNKRSVWTVPTFPFPEAHFATFPPALILPCVLAGCPAGGTVLDPFSGAGTTGLVAKENGREYIGIELKPEYVAIAEKRLAQEVLFK